jgi:ribokinase
MGMYDVVTIADVCADLIVVGQHKPRFGQVELLADSYALELGGSASIFASQIAKLGGKVALVAMLGNDSLGSFLQQRIQALGIDTSYLQFSNTSKTPLGLNLSIKEDRAMLTVLGSLTELSFSHVPYKLLNLTRHWHIAGYFLLNQLTNGWPAFIEKLKSKRITISLDTNWAPDGDWHRVMELLPLVDVFLPNENEAMAITNQSDYRKAGVALSSLVKCVVIKRGAEGASAFVEGVETLQSIPVEIKSTLQVIDTTGAGDSFDGGFIIEWLKKSPLEQCLATGIACGTSSVQAAGGINGQLTLS